MKERACGLTIDKNSSELNPENNYLILTSPLNPSMKNLLCPTSASKPNVTSKSPVTSEVIMVTHIPSFTRGDKCILLVNS